jgi:hypothetical protein
MEQLTARRKLEVSLSFDTSFILVTVAIYPVIGRWIGTQNAIIHLAAGNIGTRASFLPNLFTDCRPVTSTRTPLHAQDKWKQSSPR